MEPQRKRILVIEDDLKFGRLVARVLAPEHDVLVLTSAREALEQIPARERFDLVLCDLMLPGVSGVEFHERLSSMAPDLVGRIVFVTGGAYCPRTMAFLERPDIQHLNKPFHSLASFRDAVREFLQRLADRPADQRGGSR